MDNFEKMRNEISLKNSALDLEQRRLETLISNLPGVVYRCQNSNNRTMEFLSEGCMKLTGYSSSELVRDKIENYTNLINREDEEWIYSKVTDAIASKQPYTLEYRIRTKDDIEKWVWEQGRGIFNTHGELEDLEGFIIDITLQKQAHYTLKNYNQNLEKEITLRGKELLNTNEELKDINSQLNDFVAIVAHDLRNPIGNIISLCEIGKDPDYDGSEPIINTVERIAKSSLELVMDILDIAALKGGNIKLDFQTWNFAELATDVLDMIQFAANKKDITIVNDAKIKFIVNADKKRISQVISNLLSNAIKFTERSGIVTLKTTEEKGRLLIELHDNGVGIPPSDYDSLFSKSTKTTKYGTDGEIGTGYGLPFCQDLIKEHNSEIKIKQRDGGGSIFYFYLKS